MSVMTRAKIFWIGSGAIVVTSDPGAAIVSPWGVLLGFGVALRVRRRSYAISWRDLVLG